MQASTYEEYQRLAAERREIISKNRSRHMKGLPALPVPPKPQPPMVMVAYDAEGNYLGVINNEDECPTGGTIRMEPAIR